LVDGTHSGQHLHLYVLGYAQFTAYAFAFHFDLVQAVHVPEGTPDEEAQQNQS
jgi:hypothetical protein